MTIQELITDVQTFIGDGKTDAAFDILVKNVPTLYPKGMMDLMLLKSRYSQAHFDFDLRGVITKDEYDARVSQINYAILEFIENMANPSATQTPQTTPTQNTTVKSNTGKLLHNIPSKMALRRDTRCTVRIAYDEITVAKDFAKTDDTVVQDVRIAEVMNVELVDFNDPPCFTIRSMTENEQFLESNEYTQWLFLVKAIQEGTHPLTIKVAVLEVINGKERSRDIVLEKEVFISATEQEIPEAKFVDTKIAVSPPPSANISPEKFKVERGAKKPTAQKSQPPPMSAPSKAGQIPAPQKLPASPKPVLEPMPAAATSQPSKRSFFRIASVLAFLLVGAGGFYTMTHLGGSAKQPDVASRDKNNQPETSKNPDPRKNDTLGEVVITDPTTNDKKVTPSETTHTPKKDKPDGSDVAINTKPIPNGNGSGEISASKSNPVKRPVPVITYKTFPKGKVNMPNNRAPVILKGLLIDRTVQLYNKREYKDLTIIVDGQPVTINKSAEGFIESFTFKTNPQQTYYKVVFLKGGKTCTIENLFLTDNNFVLPVCNLS